MVSVVDVHGSTNLVRNNAEELNHRAHMILTDEHILYCVTHTGPDGQGYQQCVEAYDSAVIAFAYELDRIRTETMRGIGCAIDATAPRQCAHHPLTIDPSSPARPSCDPS